MNTYITTEGCPIEIEGISKIQRDIIWNRLPVEERTKENVEDFFYNKLELDKDLDKLTDIDKAAELIKKHIRNNSQIVIIGDRDADGIDATATLYKGLVDILGCDENNVRVIINPRRAENGVSQFCLDLLRKYNSYKHVDLVMTCDHGSTDNERYKIMKEEINCDILVTDHHTVQYDNYPDAADVFINPQRQESTYYKTVSGCQVALVTLIAAYKAMCPGEGLHVFNKLLPYSALTVISDVMPLNNAYNRYVVKTGLHEMNKYDNPVWLTCKHLLDIPGNITSEDIKFKLAALINTANRTHHEMLGFRFLTAKTREEALEYGKELAELNNKRKYVTNIGVQHALRDIDPVQFPNSVVGLSDSSYAINGLIAARLGDKFRKPAICFSISDELAAGSCRGILNGFNILKVLTNIKLERPDIIVKLGGHAGACGCTIKADKIEDFKTLFDVESKKEIDSIDLSSEIVIDAEVGKDDIDPKLALALEACGPYGKDWESPCLHSKLEISRAVVQGPYVTIYFTNGSEGGCYIENLDCDTSSLVKGVRADVYYSLGIPSVKGVYNFSMDIKEIRIA